jgi:iron complex transport system substrate-binding protein
MNRVTLANTAALLLAIGLTIHLGRGQDKQARASVLPPQPSQARTSLADSTGQEVPIQRYRRIISTNLVLDRLLLELAEPERVLAFSRSAAERQRDGYRYAGRPAVDGFGPVEALIALGPDLVLTNSHGAHGRAARLRAAGIAVFDLGELRGIESLARVAKDLAELLGAPERGQEFARGFEQRMHHVASGLTGPRKSGLFLTNIGAQIQGGTTGTSLHDILVTAGLSDVAASQYRDWPSYSSEQLLALSPDVIVTKQGMAAAVCSFPGADHLAACAQPARIVEIPAELVDEPGPSMLEAAEEIYRQVYGQ